MHSYIDNLSKRELEVLTLVGEKLSTKEIAKKLVISPHTVTSHRKSLLNKLGAENSAELVRLAFEYKLISS